MLPDRVSNPGPLTYESGVLPIALRGPAPVNNYIGLEVEVVGWCDGAGYTSRTERPINVLSSRARAFCD